MVVCLWNGQYAKLLGHIISLFSHNKPQQWGAAIITILQIEQWGKERKLLLNFTLLICGRHRMSSSSISTSKASGDQEIKNTDSEKFLILGDR